LIFSIAERDEFFVSQRIVGLNFCTFNHRVSLRLFDFWLMRITTLSWSAMNYRLLSTLKPRILFVEEKRALVIEARLYEEDHVALNDCYCYQNGA